MMFAGRMVQLPPALVSSRREQATVD
jgi:hypothetical protein